MAAELFALTFDAEDPRLLARFWGRFLDRHFLTDEPGAHGITLLPPGDDGFRIGFRQREGRKTHVNRIHFDLTSDSLEQQERSVARVLELGGRHFDVGQLPEEEHVVLADPEDNEFCVIEPGNNFLAGCGFIGALSCDGSREVGYFWSKALDWPLVWDQDDETAIQSPQGGTKIAWGGPPSTAKTGPNRVHFDLVARGPGGPQGEVDRLVALGASVTGGTDGRVELVDPDDNEFCVLAAPATPAPTRRR